MLHKTRGIVLHNLNYSDTYSIVTVFTEEFGIVPYMTSKGKGKKARLPQSVFYPLSIIDMEVEHRNLRNMQQLKEAKAHLQLFSLLNDPVKMSISIFLAEFISKVVKEVEVDRLLFNYIFHSIRILDMSEESTANFHLVFLIRLSPFLGFEPDSSEYGDGMFFDMKNGVFVSGKPLHGLFLNPVESKIFSLLMRMNYENMHVFRFSRYERKAIIYNILNYYRIHLADFPDLKSLEILHDVFG
jgi:DNA repair protein RecO (recombination protein O)